jgi:hypothetical protein
MKSESLIGLLASSYIQILAFALVVPAFNVALPNDVGVTFTFESAFAYLVRSNKNCILLSSSISIDLVKSHTVVTAFLSVVP